MTLSGVFKNKPLLKSDLGMFGVFSLNVEVEYVIGLAADVQFAINFWDLCSRNFKVEDYLITNLVIILCN